MRFSGFNIFCGLKYAEDNKNTKKNSWVFDFAIRLFLNFSRDFNFITFLKNRFPAGNYLFKVNNRNIRTRCETCLKLTIKTPERRHWTYFTPCSSVSIVNFEQVNANWGDIAKFNTLRYFVFNTVNERERLCLH